jgi:hypothetical protein
LVEANPTAVQVVGVGQDTPERPVSPAGLGVGWTVQLDPFQRSASRPRGFPELSKRPPTAVQAEAAAHETAPSWASALVDVGAVWTLHFFPFQPSVIVPTGLPELSVAMPTAMHAEADEHETPVRNPDCAPAGSGGTA